MSDTIVYDIPHNVKVIYLEKASVDEKGILKFLKIPFLAFKYSKLLKSNNITVSISFLSRSNYINIISNLFYKNTRKIISERSFPSQTYGDKSLNSKINNLLIKKTNATVKSMKTNNS